MRRATALCALDMGAPARHAAPVGVMTFVDRTLIDRIRRSVEGGNDDP
jgi:hypothetical protein